MVDDIWTRETVSSPCVRICVVHPTERICTGCLRTIDEITRWSAMSEEDRRIVMADLPSRAPRLTQRRGGRAGRLKQPPQL